VRQTRDHGRWIACRRTCSSWAVPSFIIWDRRSRCCSSRSFRSAEWPGCGSSRRRSCSPPAVAGIPGRPTTDPLDDHGPRRGVRSHELQFLPRHRPAAARHRRGDRIHRPDRARPHRQPDRPQSRRAADRRRRRLRAHRCPSHRRTGRVRLGVPQRRAVHALHHPGPSPGPSRRRHQPRRPARWCDARRRCRHHPARDDGRGPRLHQPHCRPGRHRCRHQQFGDPLRSGPAGDDQAPSRHLRPVRRPAPATAVVIGLAVLHQVPRPIELVGVGLVMVGVLVHAEPRSRAEPRPGGRGTERYSQPTPSSSASRSERYPGSPRRIGSAPAARTAVQFS